MGSTPIPQGASIGDATNAVAPSSSPAPAASAGAMAIPQGATVGEPAESSAPAASGDQQPQRSAVGSAVDDFGKGVSTGFGNLGYDVVNAVNKGIRGLGAPVPAMPPKEATVKQAPSTIAAHLGEGGELLLEFMSGDGEMKAALKGLGAADRLAELGRIIKPLEKYPRLARVMMNGVRDAMTGAAQSKVHGASNTEAAEAGAGVGAGSVLLGGFGQVISNLRARGVHFNPTEAAAEITRAVNPSAEVRDQFSANLSKQLAPIMDYAEKHGIAIRDRASLRDAAQGLASEAKDLFYKQMVEPIKERAAGIAGETIGPMAKRVRDLNELLSGSYGREVTAEGKLAMKDEANRLRGQLHGWMDKHLQLAPGTSAEVHARIGEAQHVADTVTQKLNEVAEKLESGKQSPSKVDVVNPLSKNFVVNKLSARVANMARGTDTIPGTNRNLVAPRGDRMIKNVFKDIPAQPQRAPIVPQPAQPVRAPRSEPTWKRTAEAAPAPAPKAADAIEQPLVARVAGRPMSQAAAAAYRSGQAEGAARTPGATATIAEQQAAKNDTRAMQRAIEELHPGKKFNELRPSEQSKVTMRAQEIKR